MLNSKLLEVLRLLTPKQLRHLEDFILSPYFNKNEEVSRLFQTLLRFAPDFRHADLERKRLFALAFPDTPYNEKKLGYWMSDVQKLTEQYLADVRVREQPVHLSAHNLLAYTELGLEKHYNKVLQDARNTQQKSPYRDADYFYNEYLLEFANNVYFDKQRKHAFDESLQKAIDNLDLYYLALKLKFSCEMYNRRRVVATDYHLRLLDEILSYVRDKQFENAPSIAIYYRILMTLTEGENETHFVTLKQLLKEHAERFTTHEARDMYAYAQNYCIRKVNSGDSRYLNELFDLYKATLENKVIFDGKYLSPWTYKNVVGVALWLKEFDWAQRFINEYREQIGPKFRDNAYTYNQASYHFKKEDYEEALQLLRNVEFSDIFYSLDSKAMLLCIYYELSEEEPLFSLLDAFKIYLKRNKLVSDYQRVTYLNLVKFTRRLLKLSISDKDRAIALRDKIKDAKQVAYSQWLLSKVNEYAGA